MHVVKKKIKQWLHYEKQFPRPPQATVLFLHGDFASFIYSPERFCAYTKCLCMYYGMLHLCVRMSIHRCIDLLFKMRLLYRSLVCVNCSLRPVGCSPPGFPVHGILQARLLEWVAILFSRGSFWPRDWTLYCRSPVLQTDSLASEPPEKPKHRPSFFFKKMGNCVSLYHFYVSFILFNVYYGYAPVVISQTPCWLTSKSNLVLKCPFPCTPSSAPQRWLL